jgi:hypothetical protein
MVKVVVDSNNHPRILNAELCSGFWWQDDLLSYSVLDTQRMLRTILRVVFLRAIDK